MTNKIFLLVHWDARKNKHNVIRDGLVNEGFHVEVIDNPLFSTKDFVLKHRIFLRWLKYFNLGIRAIMKTKKSDTILCLSYTAGIALTFFNKLCGLKRKIILINLIARHKTGITYKIRKVIYHYLLCQENLIVTLNSLNLIEPLQKEFNIDKGVFKHLPDSTTYLVVNEKPYFSGNGYVFAGGDSSRDWESFIKAAILLPQINFIIVASEKNFRPKTTIPKNVTVKLDINEAEFYDYLYNSSLVVLPIAEDVPAGLIVIVNASILHKPVIATQTSSIGNYITHYNTGLIYKMNDANDLAKNIDLLFENEILKKQLSNNLYNYIQENYTDAETVKKLIEMYKMLN